MLNSICAFAQMESSISRIEKIRIDSVKNVFSLSNPPYQDLGYFKFPPWVLPCPELKTTALSTLVIKDWTMPLRTVIPGLSTLFQWGNGGVVANGFSATYPGLMKIDSGSLGIYQRIGNLSYYIGGVANKYGYFKGINTQYGINGSISYQFTPDFSLTAFGAYYFGRPSMMCNGLPMPPSMIGYYGLSRFGGYFDYRISERFGVKIGGQAVQQFGLNRFEFEPIATPYIKAGTGKRKFRIELPVGQILYNSLKK